MASYSSLKYLPRDISITCFGASTTAAVPVVYCSYSVGWRCVLCVCMYLYGPLGRPLRAGTILPFLRLRYGRVDFVAVEQLLDRRAVKRCKSRFYVISRPPASLLVRCYRCAGTPDLLGNLLLCQPVSDALSEQCFCCRHRASSVFYGAASAL